MTILEKLGLLTDTINLTEKLNGEEFNKNSDALNTFKVVYGEEHLNHTLSEKQDLHLNRFYYPDWIFQKLVEENNIKTVEANAFADKIANRYTKDWLKIFLIKRAIELFEFDTAEGIINELPDEDKGPSRFVGHRLILKYYAEVGDIDEFKKRIKPSKPGKFPRHEIQSFKFLLVEGYSKKFGYQKGLELCNDKFFEKVSSIAALRWTAHLIGLHEIDQILDNYPKVLVDSPNGRADLFVLHFKEGKVSQISDDDFKRVLNEIMKIDKDIKAGDGRLRDFLLMDFGSSTSNRQQTLECKKLIISPFYKKELNYFLTNSEK